MVNVRAVKCSKTAWKRHVKLFFDCILINYTIGVYSSAATLKVVIKIL